MRALLLMPFFLVAVLANPTPEDKCDPERCKASGNCVCASTDPPNKMNVQDTPQLVTLSFDGAIHEGNMPFYRELLDGTQKRKNKKSGCKIGATFFVNHEYLDYTAVHELHNSGSEIGLRSITLNGTSDYWSKLGTDGWKAEMVGERDLLANHAAIPASDIVGMRAPLLQTGGDNTYAMLKENGFLYDSSIPHNRVKNGGKPMFPYTLDHGLQTECIIAPCPENKYPGLWTVPMNVWFQENDIEGLKMYFPCSTIGGCVPPPDTADETYEFLMANFKEFYENNRAPFPMFLHEGWLHGGERREGFLKFIDWLLTKDDVFIVTLKEVIEFMKNPKPVNSYKESRCLTEVMPSDKCTRPETCHYRKVKIGDDIGDRKMKTCVDCAPHYPWVSLRKTMSPPQSE
ncbi:chitin deacetylase 8-like [Ixodes scapularis]